MRCPTCGVDRQPGDPNSIPTVALQVRQLITEVSQGLNKGIDARDLLGHLMAHIDVYLKEAGA